MLAIEVILDGMGCWPDLGPIARAGNISVETSPIVMALLDGSTNNQGEATVTIRVDLMDGKTLLLETSLERLVKAVREMQVHEKLRAF